MKGMKRKIAVAIALTMGTIIGAFRGEIAKQKFISKVKSRYENHNHVQRQHEIMLDEFELSAFHTS